MPVIRKQNMRFCRNQPGLDSADTDSPLTVVKAYHQRTKHSIEEYDQGPESLDWDAQPDPYRSYEGCATIPLPLQTPDTPYSALFNDEIKAAPLCLESIAQLVEYSLALSAVKVFGPTSWTVRCNPSSGNLHPTEAYVICDEVDGLHAGVYHYNAANHHLEQRAAIPMKALAGTCYLALTSVHWREAWKYGERAYRYCQLDVGHAIAAVRYSAALLGWRVTIVQHATDNTIARWCGIDRNEDFSGVERETADLLLRIETGTPSHDEPDLSSVIENAEWFGRANLLDPRPFYHWQLIDQISQACEKKTAMQTTTFATGQNSVPRISTAAAQLIKQRRSALAFQAGKGMDQAGFVAIMSALLPERRSIPLDLLTHSPRLHPIVFVHQVEGLAPGLYCLPRSPHANAALQEAMLDDFLWQPALTELPLYLLREGTARAICKTISCHQAIASDSAFSLGMLAEFDSTLSDGQSWRYRELYWEAGILGQILYLEAEAHGYRGTGIGCFFDDLFHQLLGLQNQAFQSLYHFTVGVPVVDPRITTLSPYAGKE